MCCESDGIEKSDILGSACPEQSKRLGFTPDFISKYCRQLLLNVLSSTFSSSYHVVAVINIFSGIWVEL